MTIKIFFSLAFLAILLRLEGQIPLLFAKDDLFGVKDANQNVILEPKFAQIKIHDDYGIIAGQINSTWQFYNFSGRLLVKSDFKRYKIESLHGRYVDDKFVDGSFVPLSHLVVIQEELVRTE